jgi:hypothetical protein
VLELGEELFDGVEVRGYFGKKRSLASAARIGRRYARGWGGRLSTVGFGEQLLIFPASIVYCFRAVHHKVGDVVVAVELWAASTVH